MQIILLDKVTNLGDLGDTVNVKSGYARNFLIPQGKAVLATKKNIEYFKLYRIKLESDLIKMLEKAKCRADKIIALGDIIIQAKAGDEGKLFGSIGARDIAKAIVLSGVHISKNEVKLKNGIIRKTGEYEVGLQLHREVFINIKINVIPES